VYHTIVRRKLLSNFQKLNQGDYEAIVRQFSPSAYHHVAGDLSLGGERHSRDGIGQWYTRLYRIFPGIQFTVRGVVIQGLPWDTPIAVQFQVSATLKNGQLYTNEVAQFIRLKWGQIAQMRLYEDTQKLAAALDVQSAAGVSEAKAAPIAG